MVGLDWKLDMFKITRKTLFRLIQAAAIARCTPYLYSLHKGSTLSRGSFCVKALYRTDRGCTFPNTIEYQRRQLQEGNLYIFNTSGRPSNTTGLNYYNEANLFSKAIHLPSPTFSHFLLDIDRGINAASAIRGCFFYTFCRSGDKLRWLLNDFTNTTVMDCIA